MQECSWKSRANGPRALSQEPIAGHGANSTGRVTSGERFWRGGAFVAGGGGGGGHRDRRCFFPAPRNAGGPRRGVGGLAARVRGAGFAESGILEGSAESRGGRRSGRVCWVNRWARHDRPAVTVLSRLHTHGCFREVGWSPTCPWVGRRSARPRLLSLGSGADPGLGAGLRWTGIWDERPTLGGGQAPARRLTSLMIVSREAVFSR